MMPNIRVFIAVILTVCSQMMPTMMAGRMMPPIMAGREMSEPNPGSNNLLMGKLISQGASRSEVVGAARLQGGSDSQIEEVKGREIAESARQDVEPENDLKIGNLIKEYKENPNEGEVRMDIGHVTRERWIPVERKQGKIVDPNVKTGKVVPDPVKVLSEIKANGGDIDTVEGEIVAGDAGEVPAIRMLVTPRPSSIVSSARCPDGCEEGCPDVKCACC